MLARRKKNMQALHQQINKGAGFHDCTFLGKSVEYSGKCAINNNRSDMRK